ncbi:MAG: VanZ family protein [Ignavibacteria bacterium]
MKSFFKYHFPFIAWLLIIFIQSSFTAIELPKVELISADKIVHMGVYGLLTFLCYISLIHLSKPNFPGRSPFLWSSLICMFYGASDEIHQYFVPNRSCELQDWIADAFGVIIAVAIIKYIFEKRYLLFRRELINGS